MKILIHIGAGKTGSSAIQHMLAANNQTLLNSGVYIPSEDLTETGKVTGYQVWWFEHIKKENKDIGVTELRRNVEQTIERASRNGCEKIVISAENLCNSFNWSDYFGDVFRGCEVKVLIYIRRQDDYLLSAWQQWGIKNGSGFNEWLISQIGTTADWSVPIKEWESIASDGVDVRIYERAKLSCGDVVDDFLDFSGIDPSGISRSKQAVNPSFSIAAEELALSGAELFESAHDNEFFNFLRQYGTKAQFKKSGESRINTRQRLSIINRYQQSNDWIKSEYFQTTSGSLFKMPTDDDYRVLSESEIDRKKWALITELVYGLQRKNT